MENYLGNLLTLIQTCNRCGHEWEQRVETKHLLDLLELELMGRCPYCKDEGIKASS